MDMHLKFAKHCESLQVPVKLFDTIHSTNDFAKDEAAAELTEPVRIYVSAHQESGRGRGENKWQSPEAGSALLCSISFALEKSAQPISAPLFGLAIFNSLTESFPNLDFSLKAPNDILLDGKKCAGILVEGLQIGRRFRLIAGIGLNISKCPDGLSGVTCLAEYASTTKSSLDRLFQDLIINCSEAARASQGSNLTEQQRSALLTALNLNPHLERPYVSLSPFGDLATLDKNISWKDL